MQATYFKLGVCGSAEEAAAVRELLTGNSCDLRTRRDSASCATAEWGRLAQRTRALVSVLGDMIGHGWKLKLHGYQIMGCDPIGPEEQSKREYVRQIQLAQRELQMRKRSVRDFVRSMERRRLGPNGWTSVFSLMRDGRELAAGIRENGPDRLVPAVINPYLQVIENSNERCAFTGLRLMDVWRYFRYNWAMPYNSVPGRSMLVLVRDAAAPNHPVIGIAALGSAIVQLSQRDQWIGWTSSAFLNRVREKPTVALARWVSRQLTSLTHSVYKADLIRSGQLTYHELANPTHHTVERLLAESKRAWEIHRKFPSRSNHKMIADDETHWKRQALSPLFRAKRCGTLAQLLNVRRVLNDFQFVENRECLKAFAADVKGRKALDVLIRASKAEHVGIDMLDITICGAVPPYNPLLGGKLTALLLCSPEIVQAYARRYRRAPSIIASSMAGKAVYRRPRLVLLGTTSLYGERLNQYHRLQIPQGVGGAREPIRYVFLGESMGFGSSHLCSETVGELELFLAQTSRGRRVNSIFGEGVSPRMRKIRDGLDSLGLPSDRVLNHGNPRLIYGILLASNFREVLVGLEEEPRYVLPQRHARDVTGAISEYWGSRWLKPRVTNHPESLELVAADDIRLPQQHSARVLLPEVDDELMPLFA